MNIETIQNTENTFSEYGIESATLSINGKQTNQQVITQKGHFVASLDNRYQVLPNEVVIEQMEALAKASGLVPMTELKHSNWYRVESGSTIANQNKYGATTKIASILVKPEPYTMPDGSKVQLGLTVKNSIDGDWSFSASGFTFREICSNMMFHLASRSFQTSALGALWGMNSKKNIEDLTWNKALQISKVMKRHTKSLDVDVVAKSLQSLIEQSEVYIEKYIQMHELKMTQKIGLEIANNLPKWVLDHEPVKEWLSIEKDTIKINDSVSQWQAFNSLTESLTHNGNTFTTTLHSYNKLDRIMMPLAK